jgi:microcystin synthetase protein McyB
MESVATEELLYEATCTQVQSWRHHRSLAEGRQHEIMVLDEYLKDPDLELVEHALAALVERHESLRTGFVFRDGRLKQRIVRYRQDLFFPAYFDARGKNDTDGYIRDLLAIFKEELKQLDQAPLLRCAIFQLPDDTYYICLLIHHIICDAWSITVMRRELFTLYAILVDGDGELSPMSMQLKEYAGWQRDWMEQHAPRVRSFWQKKLGSFASSFTDLYAMGSRQQLLTVLNSRSGVVYRFCMDKEHLSAAVKLANQCRATVPAVLMTNVKLLFYLLTERDRSLIAMPVSDRFLPGADNLIGQLVGGAYLCGPLQPKDTVSALITQTYMEFLDTARNIIYDHAGVGLEEGMLRVNSTVFFNYIREDASFPANADPGRLNSHQVLEDFEHYALSLVIKEYSDCLLCSFKYVPGLYPAAMVEFLASSQVSLMEMMCTFPGVGVGELVKNF